MQTGDRAIPTARPCRNFRKNAADKLEAEGRRSPIIERALDSSRARQVDRYRASRRGAQGRTVSTVSNRNQIRASANERSGLSTYTLDDDAGYRSAQGRPAGIDGVLVSCRD